MSPASPIINGVIGRIDREDSRYYIDPSDPDTVLDSVTTVLGATTGKAWLVPWAAKLTAQYAIDHLEFLGQAVKEASPEGAVSLLKGESQRLRELKAAIGTHQHDILEALIIDTPIPECPEHLVGIEIDGESVDQDAISDGLLNFIQDHDPIPEMAEATVANPGLGTAGTLDFVGWFPNIRIPGSPSKGARLCLDLKTGSHLYDEHRAQIVTYKNMTEVWVDDLGNKAPMPQVDMCGFVHLGRQYKRGYKLYVIPPDDERFYWTWFQNAYATYKSQQDAAKRRLRVFYAPLDDGSQPPALIEDVEELGRYRQPLIDGGLKDLTDLAAMSIVALREIKGIGAKAPDQLRIALARYGLSFNGEVA